MQLPFKQPHPLRPAPDLRVLQQQRPIHAVRTALGHPAWLVTGYEEVRALLDDERLGRSHPEPEKASRMGESAIFGGPNGEFATEHEDQRRVRSMLQPHFTPRRMRALRSRVEELTAALLDDMEKAGPPADLHDALALPLPIAVICELLGVPFADRARFRAWTQAVGDVTDRARSETALGELYGYGRQLVARKRADGHIEGDREEMDVISRLATTDGVSDDEAAQFGMLMLFAGHETTVVAIGQSVMWLLGNLDQWQALVDDPGLVGNAVEEVLRAQQVGGSGGNIRYARMDIEVAGVPVRAGDLLLLDSGSANHDATAFTDPDRLDITRSTAGHLAFGHGPRYCIGAPLARIELQVVLTQLTARFPTLRLNVDVEELTFNDALTGGPAALPVTW
ncbi:cytochrome P450 [Rhizohabitans arisaemae]|uniref:cytochrome P450 n=1 Tax=Rhizohabitans arisaemae TaxID=2720610 RepID=UPI0024B11BA1|nr:cytochrome P450 [Rhizohabitans arisaemae]